MASHGCLRLVALPGGSYRLPGPDLQPQQPDHQAPEQYRVPGWTDLPCQIKPYQELMRLGLDQFTETMSCNRCRATFRLSVGLNMHEGIMEQIITHPVTWTNPAYPLCPRCNSGHGTPIAAVHPTRIHWIFLYLSGYLASLKKADLQYYCAERKIKKNGCKEELLFNVAADISHQIGVMPATEEAAGVTRRW